MGSMNQNELVTYL